MTGRWPDWTGAPAPGRAGPARLGTALLVALVAGAHVVVLDHLAEDRFGWGQGDAAMRRIEVAFVNELAPTAPPAPAPTAVSRLGTGTPRLAAVAQVPQPPAAASAPVGAASVPPAAVVASAPSPDPPPAVAANEPASPPADVPAAPPGPEGRPAEVAATSPLPNGPPVASAIGASAVATATAFEWPPSTRLSYVLLGNYRGPVHGSAQVEWLRSGNRYQVHLEASVTPFLSRRVSSEGELTDQGLAPRSMQGEQRVMLRTPRRWSLKFTPEKVTLVDGREEPAQAGMQDEASQFVQLTWIFTTRPDLLQVGRTLEVPLALSKRLERWTFEVQAQESLVLPFGEVPTFHVKPRREIVKGGDLVAQMWFAPSLQYLPVRILIHQDTETWIDLQLEKPPLQAAR